jgi:hypothetical protein
MNQIDLRGMSLAHRILAGGSVVLFILMFFKWQGVSTVIGTFGVSGWHGFVGVVLGLLTVALIVWEAGLLLGERTAEMRKMIPFPAKLVSAGLAGGILVFGILKFLTANEYRRWPEWVGTIVALAIGGGGWLVWSGEAEAAPEVQASPTP